MDTLSGSFVWDADKEMENVKKHKVDFVIASKVFFDKKRFIFKDEKHSKDEARLFCIGKVGNRILTVRFTYRNELIRILGAGYWRKGREYYEKQEA